jgi:hypothetical protein
VEPREINPDLVFLEGNTTYLSTVHWEQAQSLVESFIENWGAEASGARIMTWRQDRTVNYGVLVNVQGVVEMHYIVIFFE